ncbi:hypothetical protein Bbelb_353340 [Branchiostoma belcheri]|nr:hypothetical protein Bbelb_353340 [Branchiostoma belcheri]
MARLTTYMYWAGQAVGEASEESRGVTDNCCVVEGVVTSMKNGADSLQQRPCIFVAEEFNKPSPQQIEHSCNSLYWGWGLLPTGASLASTRPVYRASLAYTRPVYRASLASTRPAYRASLLSKGQLRQPTTVPAQGHLTFYQTHYCTTNMVLDTAQLETTQIALGEDTTRRFLRCELSSSIFLIFDFCDLEFRAGRLTQGKLGRPVPGNKQLLTLITKYLVWSHVSLPCPPFLYINRDGCHLDKILNLPRAPKRPSLAVKFLRHYDHSRLYA